MRGDNDNLPKLRRERASLIGKIERRTTTIIIANAERSRYRARLEEIERELRERGKPEAEP